MNLQPNKDHVRNLGSSNKSWRNLYLDTAIYFQGHRFIVYQKDSGTDNTIIGVDALKSNTSGYSNTVVGYNAMYSNIAGHQNTAIGLAALFANSGGYYNTAIGENSLSKNTVGE